MVLLCFFKNILDRGHINNMHPISIMPNAGMPENIDGQAHYHMQPAPFAAGMTALSLPETTALPELVDWVESMDRALPVLDRLKPADKERLVRTPERFDSLFESQERAGGRTSD